MPSGYNKSTKQNYTLVSPANKEAYKHIVDKALKAHQQNLHQAQSFKFKEVTGDEINLISQNTSVKFDVLDMKINQGHILSDLIQPTKAKLMQCCKQQYNKQKDNRCKVQTKSLCLFLLAERSVIFCLKIY